MHLNLELKSRDRGCPCSITGIDHSFIRSMREILVEGRGAVALLCSFLPLASIYVEELWESSGRGGTAEGTD